MMSPLITKKTTISRKQQFYVVSVIADKKYILYIQSGPKVSLHTLGLIARTIFKSDILGDLE